MTLLKSMNMMPAKLLKANERDTAGNVDSTYIEEIPAKI